MAHCHLSEDRDAFTTPADLLRPERFFIWIRSCVISLMRFKDLHYEVLFFYPSSPRTCGCSKCVRSHKLHFLLVLFVTLLGCRKKYIHSGRTIAPVGVSAKWGWQSCGAVAVAVLPILPTNRPPARPRPACSHAIFAFEKGGGCQKTEE